MHLKVMQSDFFELSKNQMNVLIFCWIQNYFKGPTADFLLCVKIECCAKKMWINLHMINQKMFLLGKAWLAYFIPSKTTFVTANQI